jgi:hypothetical protein
MARQKTQAEYLNEFEDLLGSLTYLGELPPAVQAAADQLRPHLQEGRAASIAQDNAHGERQVSTQRVLVSVNRGRKAASLLRLALRNHFGYDAPELAKFGVRPQRSRRRPAQQPAEPSPEPTAPPSPAPQEEPSA